MIIRSALISPAAPENNGSAEWRRPYRKKKL